MQNHLLAENQNSSWRSENPSKQASRSFSLTTITIAKRTIALDTELLDVDVDLQVVWSFPGAQALEVVIVMK